MIAIDERDTPAEPTAAAGPAMTGQNVTRDPWDDWSPQWRVKARRESAATGKASGDGVHDKQEKHSPTQAATLSPHDPAVTAARDGNAPKPRRRIVDARLWEAMTPVQQHAARQVVAAFEGMSRGMGYAGSDWTRVRGGKSSLSETQTRHIDSYVEWAAACQREKISHAMILDILVFGHSCRAVDRDRRLRAGSARENFIAGLDLYCRLQGWR